MITATVTVPQITLTLELSHVELNRLFTGLGKTSLNSRIDAGMDRDEAMAYDRLYVALEKVMDK